MSQKPQVRIVKRERQGEAEKPAPQRAAAEKESRRGARAIAENVSSWVEEFREQRRTDDDRSFASLFAERTGALNSRA
jgi:hypothetical protein